MTLHLLHRRARWLLAAAAAVLAAAGCRDAADARGPARPATTSAPGLASSGSTATTSGPATPAAAGSPVPAGTSVTSLEVAGARRSYRLHRPASLGPGAVPLVVVLHGGFGSAAQAQESYGWDAVADRHGFVVAYPDGLGRAWNVGGGCCGPPAAAGVDDVEFVRTVVTDVAARVPVDRRRVYATGMSNGAMLAYRLACDTTVFAAIGPVAGTLLGTCPRPARVSVVHVHGTADGAVRYLGGPGGGVARIDGPPVPQLVARWRSVDGCRAPTVRVDGPVTASRATCPQGRAVDLLTVAGAGHQWPGSRPRTTAERLLGLSEPTTALDATEVIRRFFAAHPAPPAG